MLIETHRHYDKMWARLEVRQQAQVLAALKLFLADQDDPQLRLHRLKGKYYPQYSLSAGGDLRVHFLKTSTDRIVLMMVGSHSQLYK